jgi:hypothetical protein
MTLARWYDKANAYAAGWHATFGVSPSLHNVALGLSVAQHETSCGDAWPGEHNWGAVQKRSLRTPERALLGPVVLQRTAPDGTKISLPDAVAKTVAEGRAKLDAAIASGTLPALDHEALHIDSSPKTGWYWVFFWAFPNDAEGAEKFIHTIASSRPTCRAILEDPNGDPGSLASAMYATHYYEGVHDPKTAAGRQANIDDYTSALQRQFPAILSALAGWSEGAAPPPPDAIDLCTILGVQRALNALGASPPLTEDGALGPKTKNAIEWFQGLCFLKQDGLVGPLTRARLEDALRQKGIASSSSCIGVTT